MFRNGLQFWHVIVLLVVVLLLFGANRLPDLAKSVGQSMKIFKNEVKDLRDDPEAKDSAQPTTDRPTDEPTEGQTPKA